MTRFALTALAVALALPAAGQPDGPDSPLRGEWVIEKVEHAAPPGFARAVGKKVWFGATTMTLPHAAGEVVEFRYAADPKKSPAAIDLFQGDKAVYLGIYRLAGDTLTLRCEPAEMVVVYGGDPKRDGTTLSRLPSDLKTEVVKGKRPRSFSSLEWGHGPLFVLKRVPARKADEDAVAGVAFGGALGTAVGGAIGTPKSGAAIGAAAGMLNVTPTPDPAVGELTRRPITPPPATPAVPVPQPGAAAEPDQEVIVSLARTGRANLFRVNIRTGDARNLTPGKGNASAPALSPDGARLAFAADWDGPTPNIYVADADGRNAKKITDRKAGMCGGPAWSPDGKRLAYTRATPPGPPEVVLLDADGTNEVVLRPDATDPAWAPDGKRLAVCARTPQGFRTGVLNADGTDLRLFPAPPNGLGYADPAWSPDGKQVAYIDQTPAGAQVFTADPDGGNARQVTTVPGNCSAPAWTPDGKTILFRVSRPPLSGYRRVPAGGGPDEPVAGLATEAPFEGGRLCLVPARRASQARELQYKSKDGGRTTTGPSLEVCTTRDQLDARLGKVIGGELWGQIDPAAEWVVIVGYPDTLLDPTRETFVTRVADAAGVPTVLFRYRPLPQSPTLARGGGHEQLRRFKAFAVSAGSAVGWDGD